MSVSRSNFFKVKILFLRKPHHLSLMSRSWVFKLCCVCSGAVLLYIYLHLGSFHGNTWQAQNIRGKVKDTRQGFFPSLLLVLIQRLMKHRYNEHSINFPLQSRNFCAFLKGNVSLRDVFNPTASFNSANSLEFLFYEHLHKNNLFSMVAKGVIFRKFCQGEPR